MNKIQRLILLTRETYNKIAKEYSRFRHSPWPGSELFLKEVKYGRILDAGAGAGRYSLAAAKRGQVVALEISVGLLKELRDNVRKIGLNSKIDIVVADMRAPPLKENFFDTILCIASLHHIPTEAERIKTLKNLARLGKSGCKMIVTCWYRWQWPLIPYLIKGLLYRILGLLPQVGDVIIPWGGKPRYYHLFTLGEMCRHLRHAGLMGTVRLIRLGKGRKNKNVLAIININ